jgi:hypothetical protein
MTFLPRMLYDLDNIYSTGNRTLSLTPLENAQKHVPVIVTDTDGGLFPK